MSSNYEVNEGIVDVIISARYQIVIREVTQRETIWQNRFFACDLTSAL